VVGVQSLRITPHGTIPVEPEELDGRRDDRPDAGIVRFRHWGINQDDRPVFEGERTVLVKRRSHWMRTS